MVGDTSTYSICGGSSRKPYIEILHENWEKEEKMVEEEEEERKKEKKDEEEKEVFLLSQLLL